MRIPDPQVARRQPFLGRIVEIITVPLGQLVGAYLGRVRQPPQH